MAGIQGSFDATQFVPRQGGGGGHPIGDYDFAISNTSITSTAANDGGLFVVEFTTQAGTIVNRYNLWNKSDKARKIAHDELTALCHAVGIFKIDWPNEGAVLRGARGKIRVDYQEGSDKYVEVKLVMNSAGFAPGAPTPPDKPVDPQSNAPGAPASGWSSEPPAGSQAPDNTTQPQQTQQPAGWGAPASNAAPNNQQPNNAPANQGWQPASGADAGSNAQQPGAAPWNN